MSTLTGAEPPVLAGRYNQIPIDSIIFGPGAIDKIADECERMSLTRLIVVASPSLARTVDLGVILERATGGRVAHVYTGCKTHVPDDVVLEAAEVARVHEVDGIISVGGGSPIDLAKAVSLCLTEDVRTVEDLARYRVKFQYPDTVEVPSMRSPGIPHISVSTTLSAGEFTNIIGITDSVRHVKDLYVDATLVPRVIVLDPVLASHTPRALWASTGMRSVDHAVEALCSTTAQPVTDALCLDALERLARFLPVSAKDSSDLHAAGQCQAAAWESIFGLTNVNLGLSHGLGHQLGARCGVPHGITSCVMLPTVLEYNLRFTVGPQAKIARIFAEAMGVPVPENGASAIVRQFIASLGLPTRLSEVGVEHDQFADIARDAMADMIVASNPRPIAGEADVIKVLESAF
ncbi:MAG: iron-containing alcohol dehydrogenase [Acidimicrobiales bacterium]